jgi:uncharacterized membrane protein
VAAAAGAHAAYFAYYTINYHWNGHTSSFDLGIFDNIVWQTAHGGPLFKSSPIFGPNGTHFGRHATFAAFLIAPPYRLWPRAETLLVIQALLVAGAAIPLYIYARRRLGGPIASLVAGSYLLHPAVHGAQLYDFHFLTIVPIFAFTLLLAVDRNWHVVTVVAALLMLAVREDVGIGMAAIGLFLTLTGAAPRRGPALLALGAGYFAVMKFMVMPDREPGVFLWMFQELRPKDSDGALAIAQTIAANPAFALSTLLREDKLTYALQILLPVGAVPLRRWPATTLLIPGTLLTLFASAVAPIQLSYQYTMHWIPYVYIASVWVLGRTRAEPSRGKLQAAVTTIAVGTLLISYQFGAVLQQNTARAGADKFKFRATEQDLVDRKARQRVLTRIPPNAAVAASERLVPHVSNRDNAYNLRNGVFDADWIVFFYARPQARSDELRVVQDALRSRSFGVEVQVDPFVVLRRGAPTDANSKLLRGIAGGDR